MNRSSNISSITGEKKHRTYVWLLFCTVEMCSIMPLFVFLFFCSFVTILYFSSSWFRVDCFAQRSFSSFVRSFARCVIFYIGPRKKVAIRMVPSWKNAHSPRECEYFGHSNFVHRRFGKVGFEFYKNVFHRVFVTVFFLLVAFGERGLMWQRYGYSHQAKNTSRVKMNEMKERMDERKKYI